MEVEGSTSCSNITKFGENKRWRAEDAIAGNTPALDSLREIITFPLLYSRQARKLGLKWPTGLLMYGPPGTGKTSLVRAVVQESGAHLVVISPHSVHRAHAGESERIMREAFADASTNAVAGKPSVVFIDEIDAMCPRRDSRREQDVRLVSQLCALMDTMKPNSASSGHVVVVASTNRVDAVDSALRRSGRFDNEIEVTTPSEEERFQILKLYTKKLLLDTDVDLQSVAASCNGYVGADLEALCREATLSAIKSADASGGTGSLCLRSVDWKHARSVVGPSITRGVTVEVPKVSWEDIGGLMDLKKKLQQAVEWPIKHESAFSRMGISPIRGVLLHGPPGCSKTTLAKAAANAAQASFFSLRYGLLDQVAPSQTISWTFVMETTAPLCEMFSLSLVCLLGGAELFSMYVGEGEALLRNTFQRARVAAPSIIFFDEADVVASKRGDSSSNSSTVGERLLSTLLTEMDGLQQAKSILVLAATNRPQAIDAALMRPGRFDLVLYVPPPDKKARLEILDVHTRNMSIGYDVDIKTIAEKTELFTGAELEGLCREAGIVALREDISADVVSNKHFQAVLESLKPALTTDDIEEYSSFLNMRSPSKTGLADVDYSNAKANRPLDSKLTVIKVGVLSILVLATAKYLHLYTESLAVDVSAAT
ncbi:Cell division control protein 48 homolog B [Linum perenne]